MEEDRFEGTSGRTGLQQRRLTDPMESTEFYDLSGSLVSELKPNGETKDLLIFIVPTAH